MSVHLILARDPRVPVVCGPRQSKAPRLMPRDEPEASAVGPQDETHNRGHPLWWPRAWAGTWKVFREYPVVSILAATAASLVPRDEPEACAVGPRVDSHSRGHPWRWPHARGGTRQGCHKCPHRWCWHGRSAKGRTLFL